MSNLHVYRFGCIKILKVERDVNELEEPASQKRLERLKAAALKARQLLRPNPGMDEILPNLFVGNFWSAADEVLLERHKIKRIISICEMEPKNVAAHESMKLRRISIADGLGADISAHFESAVRFIHDGRLRGEGVLVHCFAGVSRSVSIVVAYLLTIADIEVDHALRYIRNRRSYANPNIGFRVQLSAYRKRAHGERKRLVGEFPESGSLLDSDLQLLSSQPFDQPMPKAVSKTFERGTQYLSRMY